MGFDLGISYRGHRFPSSIKHHDVKLARIMGIFDATIGDPRWRPCLGVHASKP